MSETTRRKFLYGVGALPIVAVDIPANAQANAVERGALPTMFYVWRFSYAAEDFVPVGAFTNRADAEGLAARAGFSDQQPEKPAVIMRMTFEDFRNRAVQSHLGPIAEALERLTGKPETL